MCELCVSNPNSDTEFDTVYEQCSSEKNRKVKIKNGGSKSHQIALLITGFRINI